MFTKLSSDITFSDIEEFCREFDEGVRVEYKREIQHIPKIVSSFANTLGGIFIIGVEADQNNKVKFPIQGIPNKSGIEEQIQQSALTGIYPAVMPEVIVRAVPNTDNVVVIVRVDESPQAPHAIQNSTRVYIRVGSITQPYELKLAEIDQIEHMLKRREDSQTTIRQIHNRTEERIQSLFNTDEPNITVVAHPVFPYRPIISTGNIYEFIKMGYSIPFNDRTIDFGTRRVEGGVCFIGSRNGIFYWELNEYGFVYHREKLSKQTAEYFDEQEECLHYRQLVKTIGELIKEAQSFYEKCGYLGNIKITVRLQQVFEEKLGFYESNDYLSRIEFDLIKRQQCLDSHVSASTQSLARDLEKEEKLIETADELVGQLLWAFNVDDAARRRELVERMLDREFKKRNERVRH